MKSAVRLLVCTQQVGNAVAVQKGFGFLGHRLAAGHREKVRSNCSLGNKQTVCAALQHQEARIVVFGPQICSLLSNLVFKTRSCSGRFPANPSIHTAVWVTHLGSQNSSVSPLHAKSANSTSPAAQRSTPISRGSLSLDKASL